MDADEKRTLPRLKRALPKGVMVYLPVVVEDGYDPPSAAIAHPTWAEHDDWLPTGGHGDHHPSEDCLRCAYSRLWATALALQEVAHRAWHLLDDGGEDGDNVGLVHVSQRDADRLGDALTAAGWPEWHPDPYDPTAVRLAASGRVTEGKGTP